MLTACFGLEYAAGDADIYSMRILLFIGGILEACAAATQVRNMERQWGDLDKYRGISTSSKGASSLPGVPVALWSLLKALSDVCLDDS